jgi:DNA-binding response OmpR family regulator
MDGPETVRRLRELRSGLRVLYMSGFEEADLGCTGLDILRKPFTGEVLGQRVRAMLDP